MDAPRAYAIREERMAELEAGIARLAKRAAKLGVEVPALHKVRAEVRALPKGGHIELQIVHVTGAAPRLAGWRLLARLERLAGADANIVHGATEGLDLPAGYRTARPACDHCKTRRNRKDTFVVRHDDGRMAQVGSTCLADFLGHDDPAALAAMCEQLFNFLAACEDEDGGWGGGTPNAWALDTYLAWVHVSIAATGWCSRTTAKDEGRMGTADDAFGLMNMRGAERRRLGVPDAPPPEAFTAANAAIAWARDVSADGDYLHNIRTIARAGFTSTRTLGLAASIPPAYDRDLARAREAAARAARPVCNEYVGTVGTRLRNLRLEVLRVIPLESDWGCSNLHILEDAEGHAYKWFSTTRALEAGTTYNVDGTVKKHDEYKGRKNTVLTRCAAHTDAELEAAEAAAAKLAEEARIAKAAAKAAEKAALADGAARVPATALTADMRLATPDVVLTRVDLRTAPDGEPTGVDAWYTAADGYPRHMGFKPTAKVVAYAPEALEAAS